MTYLLDTCLISELVAKQPNQQVLDWLDLQVPETLYISVITIGEIAKGISKLAASKRKESLTKWLNESLPNRFEGRILSIDITTMVLWGNLVGQLELWGRPTFTRHGFSDCSHCPTKLSITCYPQRK
jgi:toxin FitB